MTKVQKAINRKLGIIEKRLDRIVKQMAVLVALRQAADALKACTGKPQRPKRRGK